VEMCTSRHSTGFPPLCSDWHLIQQEQIVCKASYTIGTALHSHIFCPCISLRINHWLSGIALATGWTIGGSSLGRGWKLFSSKPRPDRLWDPTRPLSNGYQGLFPGGKAAGA
jgi:hypothetical protein